MNWLFGPKKTQVLDVEKNYIIIEFLTEEQKVQKEVAIANLRKEFSEDLEETLIPYEQSFPCSLRFTFNIKEMLGSSKQPTASSQSLITENNDSSKKVEYEEKPHLKTAISEPNYKLQTMPNSVQLKKILSLIQLSSGEQSTFYENYVSKLKMAMQGNEQLNFNDHISLFDEGSISLYNPDEVLELIYEPKSFWERMKYKAKTTVKSIPSLCASFCAKFAKYLLTLMGLNVSGGVAGIIWRVIPSKMILTWIATIISMFFPMLAPILGISKLIL